MKPLMHAWLSWVLGPVGFVYCAESNDGDPDCWLAFVAVVGHAVALVLTLAMARSWSRFGRLPEFWLMLTYWIPLAGFFLSLLFAVGTGIEPQLGSVSIGRICILTTMAWVAWIPLVGFARLVFVAWRVATAGGDPVV